MCPCIEGLTSVETRDTGNSEVKCYLDVVPGERIAVLAIGRVAEVQIGKDLYGKLLLQVSVRVLTFGRRA